MTLRFIAKEVGCPDGDLCLIIEGDPSDLVVGRQVTLVLQNHPANDQAHDLRLARLPGQDPDGRPERPRVAFASIEAIKPGQVARVVATVPDTPRIYAWCGLADHEERGMWTSLPVQGARPIAEPS